MGPGKDAATAGITRPSSGKHRGQLLADLLITGEGRTDGQTASGKLCSVLAGMAPGAVQGGTYAIRNVVMDSSRHIVSTTITTFGGFLPLILEGSQFWPPFAMAIAGGVLLSTVVSFFYIPPMFMLAYRRQHRRIANEAPPLSLAASDLLRSDAA